MHCNFDIKFLRFIDILQMFKKRQKKQAHICIQFAQAKAFLDEYKDYVCYNS